MKKRGNSSNNPMEVWAKEAIKEKVAEVLGDTEELNDFVGKRIKQLLETLLNELMVDHRRLFNEQNGDVGNGFYPRGFQTALGKLNLEVPRTRIYNFKHSFLPCPYKRTYDFVQKELLEDAFALYIDGYRTQMKDKTQGKVKTVTIYTVIGISLEWKKVLFGFYIE
ncbi:MAG: transposase [Candidatus Omnitrophica bacterium]|nr:transposase [Candidatus Omnitrophota bacterium]